MKKSVFLLGAVSVVAAVQFFAPVVSAAVGSWSVNGNNMYYSDGSVLVGANNTIKNGISIQGSADYYNSAAITAHHSVGNPTFSAFRSRGTQASPTAVQNGDFVGSLIGAGHDGSQYINTSAIRFAVEGTTSAGNVPSNITMHTRPNGGSTFVERMKISPAGNVGIGTSTPDRVLHVYKQGGGDEIRVQSDAVTYGMGINGTNDGGFLFTRTNHPIYFGTNNSRRMVIGQTGNVGIGNDNPQYKLTVDGSVRLGKCQ